DVRIGIELGEVRHQSGKVTHASNLLRGGPGAAAPTRRQRSCRAARLRSSPSANLSPRRTAPRRSADGGGRGEDRGGPARAARRRLAERESEGGPDERAAGEVDQVV